MKFLTKKLVRSATLFNLDGIKHHTTPRTPGRILVGQRITRKTIFAFKVPASCVHPGFSNANDLHEWCRDHGLELQPLVPFWAGIQYPNPEPPCRLLATTDGESYPEGGGSGTRLWFISSTTILVALPPLTGALSWSHRFSSWRAAKPLRGSTGWVRQT